MNPALERLKQRNEPTLIWEDDGDGMV